MSDKKNDINFSDKAIETITALSKKLAANREGKKKTTKKRLSLSPQVSEYQVWGS